MCGIVGYLGVTTPDAPRRLDAGRNALTHRGPDDQGSFVGDSCGLGHTRLSIIDTSSASRQPMVDDESGCVLVYNGEIYNYVELRRELEQLGHRFRTDGDTEVLLRAYLEWRTDAFARLNGMFALAIWDPRRATTVLARDRFGEKPLHLHRHGDQLWFASELKALFAAGALDPRPDAQALFTFLALGDVADPSRTFFDGVTQLSPATWAAFRGDRLVESGTYWQLADDVEPVAGSSAEFDELFTDAVAIRLRSDVPVGTSLSGGLDSTAVVAAMRSIDPTHEVHAFTASFPGTSMDELPMAEAVARQLDLVLHPVPLDPAVVTDDLVAVTRANEGPIGSASVLAQYAVMRAANAAGVTVMLDGQGGDESWLGYETYSGAAVLDAACTLRWGHAARLGREWRAARGQRLTLPWARYAGMVAPRPARRAMVDLELRRRSWLASGYLDDSERIDPLHGLPTAAARPGQVAAVYPGLDATRLLLPRLLQYADRNSMAWSREVRLPFLDHRLVELATRTPVAERVRDGWTKEPIRAYLERRDLTSVARQRLKFAYQPPHEAWMATDDVTASVRTAWGHLRDAGMVTGEDPPAAPLVRWRVLSLHTWAETFGVNLDRAATAA